MLEPEPVEGEPTNLLAVYATTIRATTADTVPIYDTGFAISNLSGSLEGSKFPENIPGAITVALYPVGATEPWVLSSDVELLGKGVGLNEDGKLASMQSWVIGLTELVEAASTKYGAQVINPRGNFRGFVRFYCQFQEAMGFVIFGDGTFREYGTGYLMLSDTKTEINDIGTNPYFRPPQFE